MAASCDLIDVYPSELQFPFKLGNLTSCTLRLTNKTSRTVAFKVKTTSPRRYGVRPNIGVIPPRSSCTVAVKMQAQQVAPTDLQWKDGFLVQSMVVRNGLSAKDITSQMFVKKGGNVVDEVKLKAYVMPPEQPSKAAEERVGSECFVLPMLRIVDNWSTSELSSGSVSWRSPEVGTVSGSPIGRIVKSEEFLKAAGSAVVKRSSMSVFTEITGTSFTSSSELNNFQMSGIVAKLTEEKNSALEQNRKLRDELELVRHEVRQQYSTFQQCELKIGDSYTFRCVIQELVRHEVSKWALVLAIGLLGIILGCLMKK